MRRAFLPVALGALLVLFVLPAGLMTGSGQASVAGAAAPSPTVPPPPGSLGAVRYILNGLAVTPPHKPKRKAKLRTPVYGKYELQTAKKQKASIAFLDGTLLHLNQRTDAILSSASTTTVNGGEVEQVVVPGTNHRVKTASAVASAIGTIMDVRYRKNVMTVIVVEGAVLVSNKKGSVVVKTGQATSVKKGKKPATPKTMNTAVATAWTAPIPPPPGPAQQNIALDSNGGQVVDFSSQAAPPSTRGKLRGNAAATPNPWDARNINDGRLDVGWSSAAGQNKAQWVKVAFDHQASWNIGAILVDPAATGGHPAMNDLRDFVIRISTDGLDESQFQTIYRGTADQTDSVQMFPLPGVFSARYVELRAVDNYGGDSIDVAELEVIGLGSPGPTPTPTPTASATATPTATRSVPTASPTPSPTPTMTPLPGATNTPTPTAIPYSISLSADQTRLAAGAPARLTATVAPAAIDGTGMSVMIENVSTTQAAGPPCTSGTTCTASVVELNQQAGTYTYEADLVNSAGQIVARSQQVSVTWTAFTVTTFVADATNVPLGTTVHFSGKLNQPTDNTPYRAVIGEVRTNSLLNTTCSGTDCNAAANPTVPGTYIFELVVVDANGAIIAQSQQIPVYWQWTITLAADHTVVPAGTNVTLTAKANGDLSGSGYSIVIVADTNDSTTCTNGTMCVWQVSSNTAASHEFVAYVVDASGNQVANSGQPLTITWQQSWSIALDASPNNPSYQSSSTLTATANTDVAPSGSKIVIEDPHNSYVYDQCTSGTSCQVTVPYTDVSGGTGCASQGTGSCDYVALIVNGQTILAQSPVATVTWQSIPFAATPFRPTAATVAFPAGLWILVPAANECGLTALRRSAQCSNYRIGHFFRRRGSAEVTGARHAFQQHVSHRRQQARAGFALAKMFEHQRAGPD